MHRHEQAKRAASLLAEGNWPRRVAELAQDADLLPHLRKVLVNAWVGRDLVAAREWALSVEPGGFHAESIATVALALARRASPADAAAFA